MYDGTIFSGTGFTADGLVGGDQKSDLGSAYFGGAAVSTRTVGIHVLTVSLIQNSVNVNYEITYVPGSVEITKRPLTVTVHGASKVYNGQTGGSFSFTLGALASGDGQYSFSPKYTGPAAENKDVGVYEVSVEFAENNVTKNYEIEVIKGKLEITKKDITVSAANGSKVYDGLVGGTFDYNVSGLAYGDDKYCLGTATYSGSATKAKDVGSYTLSVTLSGNGNYNITSYSSATYTIVKKQLTVTPFANAKDYDGKGFASFDFTLDGLCQGDTKDMLGKAKFGGSATTAVNAGSYLLNVSFDNNTLTKNYEIGYRTSYAVINQKEITVTAIATDRKYNGKVGGQFDFKVEGLADGETAAILGTPIYEGTAVNAKDVGSYVLNVRFADSAAARNYKITYVSDSFEIYEDGN